MIDIHCHILPGIDDGAQSLADTLALLRLAAEDGITHLVATPHLQVGRYDNDLAKVRTLRDEVQVALDAEGLPLKLGVAAEVRIAPEVLTLFSQGRLPMLGEQDGYQVMLLEFPHDGLPLGSDKLVRWLLSRKVRPLIAHPERNKAIMRDLQKLQTLRRLGCLVQVTAASLTGQFGSEVRHIAEELLDNDWVDLLASDAHNTKYRPPALKAGYQAAAKLIGTDRARRLVADTPWSIVSSQF